jgi:glucosylceramidase
MKTNGDMNHGGKLKPEYRQAWANYYVKYIQEMEKSGFPMWGLSVQNEPAATQIWDSCEYTAEEERDFVRDYLGPALHQAGMADKKLIIWDHNRDIMVERASTVLEDPEAAKYVWGTGFHWYGDDAFENVKKVKERFPDHHLIFTEGCQEGGPHIGSWDLGERYARSMIHDLNNGTDAWVDWNMLLDTKGGPNHVGNYCSAPILADTANDKLLFQSSYYYMGHFSRFLKPGARSIRTENTREDVIVAGFTHKNSF